ncbi:MAG: HD domain-containing phosphohydrolase [bacterium]
MRRIIPLELVGYKKLDYDLYDEKGEVVYKSGSELTPDILIMLNFKKVYIKDDITSLDFDKVKSYPGMKNSLEFESIISKNATTLLVESTKDILKKVLKDKIPDISICITARDTILQEVKEKLEKIECISQLRVFDEYTFSHTINVSTISSALGITLGLSENDVKDLALGALLHDIGKMRIPKNILNKPDKLTPSEFELVKKHTTLGYQFIMEKMDLQDKIAKVALEHQEKYGGEGYPNGLKNKEISLFAQITSIADVYDALISKRVYKKAIFSKDALKIMLSEGSSSFNPYMLYKFVFLAKYKDKVNLSINEEDKI